MGYPILKRGGEGGGGEEDEIFLEFFQDDFIFIYNCRFHWLYAYSLDIFWKKFGENRFL